MFCESDFVLFCLCDFFKQCFLKKNINVNMLSYDHIPHLRPFEIKKESFTHVFYCHIIFVLQGKKDNTFLFHRLIS